MAPIRYLSTLTFDDSFLDRLRAVSPEVIVEQFPAETADDIPANVWSRTDVLHTSRVFPPLGMSPHLRWIQLDTSGADHVRVHPVWKTEVAITTLGGVGPVAMAEYVMFSVLGMAHRLPALIAARSARQWPSPPRSTGLFTPAPVRGTTMVIAGYGRIGREISRLAPVFGIRVIGVARGGPEGSASEREQYDGRRVANRPDGPVPRFVEPLTPLATADDEVMVVPTQRLDEALALADWLVVVLPHTEETHGMLDGDRLRKLKSGAVLINASRGGIVDEGALLTMLRSGLLAGAVLDVFGNEPLQTSSPWWDEPAVFLTPHVAGLTPDYDAHVEYLVTENLRRFLRGASLLNLLDRKRGY